MSVRGHAAYDDVAAGSAETHELEYDLLTAALIGLTVGAGLTFMLRRGPTGRRPVSPVVRGVGRGAAWAGRHAADVGLTGARWAGDRGEELWDRIPRKQIKRQVEDYVGRAREAIDDAVEAELRDLRRAMKRQRKRLGV